MGRSRPNCVVCGKAWCPPAALVRGKAYLAQPVDRVTDDDLPVGAMLLQLSDGTAIPDPTKQQIEENDIGNKQ